MALEELAGEFSKVIFQGENGFIIGKLFDSTAVVGESKPGALAYGGVYRFFGRWEQNKRHGKQFRFDHFIEDEPLTRHSVVSFFLRYLKVHGMTPNRAQTLFDNFNAECIRKLREDPAACAAIMKVDPEKANAMASVLASLRSTTHARVELVGILEGKGFPRKLIDEAIERWGPKAAGFVKADPFKLLTGRFKGAGFARCDTLYLSLGHDPAKMKRQVLAAWDEIGRIGDGDTWIPMSHAIEAVRRKIGAAECNPTKAINLGLRSRLLARQPYNGINWIALGDRAGSEVRLSYCVQRIRSGAVLNPGVKFSLPTSWPKIDQGRLTDHQYAELQKAVSSRVGFLVGTPGTGKTFTAASLIRSVLSEHSSGSVAVCAPTGKAAVRVAEAMKAEGVSILASTIHSLLMPSQSGHGTGKWGFQFHERNRIPIKFLIVDEASMVDTDLAADLFAALPYDCNVLWIGDPFQLPPVGHGAPLRDLIAADESVGRLTEVKRNAGLIVHGCRSIKDGERFKSVEKFGSAEDNLVVFNAAGEVESIARLKSVYAQLMKGGKRDVFDDVQVLTPMNTRGSLSRENLSSIIQEIVNPREPGDALQLKYRAKDKVICTSNGYYPDPSDDELEWFVANGEMGRVKIVEKTGWVHAEFPPLSGGFQPRLVKFYEKAGEGSSFALGYCITVHKSQGSQWPVVVVIADPSAGRVAMKEWWYTAISRASERCIVIGQKAVVEKQSRASSTTKRKTFLAERLARDPKLTEKQ